MDETQTTKKLFQSYINPENHLFLEQDTRKLYEAAKNDANLYPVTYKDIDKFKRSIENISRGFQSRTLRSRRRHLEFRSWLTYAPHSILLGNKS